MTNDLRKQKFAKIMKEELQIMKEEARKNNDLEKLKEIQSVEEGIVDFGKEQFGKLKRKGVVKYVGDIAKGVGQVGIRGRGTTMLGGVETLDAEEREAKSGAAANELEQVLKTTNSPRLTKLKANLDSDEFPNSDLPAMFKADVEEVKGVYNEIKSDFEAKKISAKRANEEIAALRDIVIYYQDYKISDKYLYVTNDPKLFEAEKGAVSKTYSAAYASKLPLGLLAGGATLAGLGYILNDSEVFRNILESLKTVETVDTEKISSVVTDAVIKPGDGITDVANNITKIPLGANSPAANLADPKVMNVFNSMLDSGAFRNTEAAKKVIEAITANAGSGKYKTVAELLKAVAKGTELRNATAANKINPSQAYQDLMMDPGKFKLYVSKKVESITKNQTKQSLYNMILEKAKWMAGPILMFAGAAIAGGGVASGALRAKGKTSSRMATLKDLVDSLDDVVAVGGEQEPEDANPEDVQSSEEPETAPASEKTPEEATPPQPSQEPEKRKAGQPPEPPKEETGVSLSKMLNNDPSLSSAMGFDKSQIGDPNSPYEKLKKFIVGKKVVGNLPPELKDIITYKEVENFMKQEFGDKLNKAALSRFIEEIVNNKVVAEGFINKFIKHIKLIKEQRENRELNEQFNRMRKLAGILKG